MKYFFLFALTFFLIINHALVGQTDTLLLLDIDKVVVKATRLEGRAIRLPLSVTTLSFENSQDSRQQLSFNEYLMNVPGLFALNANNFAQDLRVSIRGFGARAAFGIRGVKILVDGIPETTPDGQGQIDNLNLGNIENIEVIRGPTSSLYGNASGGVISINTMKKIDRNFIQGGLTLGSYNMQKYQLTIGFKLKNTDLLLLVNRLTSDGFRERSAFESTNFNARIIHHFSEKSNLNINFNYANSPKAQDAGGLKLEDVKEDREQARGRNVDFKTGEAIDQFRGALSYEYKRNNSQTFKTYGFYSTRNFYGKLPFEFGGIINLKRNYVGHGSSYQLNQKWSKGVNEIQFGYELALQNDARMRFRNLMGTQGDITLDQNEIFANAGIYLMDHFAIGKWHINTGLRYDWNELEVDDNLINNGDDSGSIKLKTLNPSVGISYVLGLNQSVYLNFSTSFETPSLSELSADPMGNAGFNTDLEAQKSKNYELGWKGSLKNNASFGLAVFHIDTENDLVPFELEAFPDRTFFQNAGSTTRDGFELEMAYPFLSYWSVNATYTFSDFKYKEYVRVDKDFGGKQLPGIPKNMASVVLQYAPENGLYFQLNGRHNGSLYANNSNEAEVDDYLLVNTNIAYNIQLEKFSLKPFFGVNNLFDTEYNDNIRINGFGSRFYEPAPGINFYAGVKVRLE